jgi:hypothetical protein
MDAETVAAERSVVNLRERADAAKSTWPRQDDATTAFAAACSPERILALIDVADAAERTHELKASPKSRWWREDGMAGAGVADQTLRDALARWREVSG